MENQIQNKNIKTYSILSYIGILWIIGLFVKEKNDKTLKFHVGQGMLLSVLGVVGRVAIRIISSIIVNVGELVFGDNILFFLISIMIIILSLAFSVSILVLMIIGIVNASNNKEEALPVVGKYAFYK